MKRSIGVIWVVLLLIFGLTGCQQAAMNGATMLAGAGAPAATLGAVGDFYLDRSAVVVYGPKTASGWGSGVALVGSSGPAGPEGPIGAPSPDANSVLSGITAPAAGLGKIGDFYIDTLKGQLYGPKSAGGWGFPASLVGPLGPSVAVTYSNWATLAQAWTITTYDGTRARNNFITTPAVTASIIDTGQILVYFRFGSAAFPLPYTSFAGGGGNTIWASPRPGRIDLYRTTHNVSVDADLIGISSSLEYRFILIPGTTLASAEGGASGLGGVDWKKLPYEEVIRLLGIPE